jgi:hypothetical protein
MTDSGLQGWHVSLFVTLAILVIQWLVHLVLPAARSEPEPETRPAPPQQRDVVNKRVRAGFLAGLGAVALVIVAVSLLGPALADQLAGVTATTLGGISLWLAWLNYKESVKLSSMIQTSVPEKDQEKRAT